MESSSSEQYAPSEESAAESSEPSRKSSPRHESKKPMDLDSHSENERPSVGRKRKREVLVSSSRSTSRYRGLYRSDYHDLFNEAVNDANSPHLFNTFPSLESSLIGITYWSSEEKGLVFDCLARKGRDAKAIATIIGTKSEPEVQVYLQLLRERLLERAAEGDPQVLISDTEMLAALQISRSCEKQLDLAAEGLASRQKAHEISVEKKRHGTYWLLDQETSDLFERPTESGEDIGQDLETARGILSLGNMLKLSSRFFMNSLEPESNWRTYSESGELPSIFCTAFVDLHRLVVGIVKRLVSSALFFAMSRIRRLDNKFTNYKRHVRKQDVYAALDITGMRLDRKGYWINLARRCNLEVCDGTVEKGAKNIGNTLSHNEVEERLRQPYARDASPEAPEAEENVSDNSDDAPGTGADSVKQVRTSPSCLSTADDESQDEDEYVEAVDMRASRREERRLWELLELDPPERLWADHSVPPVQSRALSAIEDAGDWRNWTTYQSRWETYDSPIKDEAFEKNRQLRTNHPHESSRSLDEEEH